MALIKCPECKKKISETASACPKCGCKISPQYASALKAKEEKEKNNLLIGCTTLLLLFIGFIILGNLATSSSSTTTKSKKAELSKEEIDKIAKEVDQYIKAKNYNKALFELEYYKLEKKLPELFNEASWLTINDYKIKENLKNINISNIKCPDGYLERKNFSTVLELCNKEFRNFKILNYRINSGMNMLKSASVKVDASYQTMELFIPFEYYSKVDITSCPPAISGYAPADFISIMKALEGQLEYKESYKLENYMIFQSGEIFAKLDVVVDSKNEEYIILDRGSILKKLSL